MHFGLAPTQSKPTFEAMIRQARLAEDLGFETLWAHEHHSQGIELIRALWQGRDVTQSGEDFGLEGFRLFPLPVQKPAPPIYVGGQVEAAIRRAAALGDGYLISTTELIEDVARRVESHRAARMALGRPAQRPLLNRIVCAVGSRHEKREAEDFDARALLALHDAWGHENVTRLPPAEREPERVSRKHFVLGEPSECVERIEEYAELGIGHIACLMSFGGPDPERVERSMRIFGEQVMPHFSQ